jgi:predicted amidohydrolase
VKQQAKHRLTIALLQMQSFGLDQTRNMQKGDQFCRRAAAMGADIALFPEMWNMGYQSYDPEVEGAQEAWLAEAVSLDSAFVTHFRALARELSMGMVLGVLLAADPKPKNAALLISPSGELLMTYAKVHTCGFSAMEAVCQPGEAFEVTDYAFGADSVKIGLMICFDREFPESARILMLKGAEIILTPNACLLDHRRLDQFRTRAFENLVGVAMTNYSADAFNGHSCAFTEKGNLLVMVGEAEDIYLASFDLAALRANRQRKIWGDAFRRPSTYGDLLNPEAIEPFKRKDAFGHPLKR